MRQYHYEEVKKPKRSAFDLSHEHKTTMNVGRLVPVLCEEVVPGDQFSISTEALIRLQPMVNPVMHRINTFVHFFFVPYRILLDAGLWEKFITGNNDGTPVEYKLPQLVGAGSNWMSYGKGSLPTYFGLNTAEFNGVTQYSINMMPFRAYQQIFNDYYRDQTLQTEVPFDKSLSDLQMSDPSVPQLLQIRVRNLEKDYFTSALPQPQFGDPVTLPISGTAPVVQDASNNFLLTRKTNNPTNSVAVNHVTSGGSDNTGELFATGTPASGLKYESGLEADLSLATASSVTDIRRAFALQRYQEALMRGGRRLKEWTLNIFGVNVPDARIQRAEFLGGGKMPIQISEVLASYGDDTNMALGEMGGHGIGAGNVTGFSKYFHEHGVIIGIMSIVPRTAYMQGIPKLFLKSNRFEFYTPHFAHIGEQAIKLAELYSKLTDAELAETFGYTPRYAEYRDRNDRVTGEFALNTGGLMSWHLGMYYGAKPVLNEQFVKAAQDASFNRAFAVQTTDYDKYLVQIYFRIKAIRNMSKFGQPI